MSDIVITSEQRSTYTVSQKRMQQRVLRRGGKYITCAVLLKFSYLSGGETVA